MAQWTKVESRMSSQITSPNTEAAILSRVIQAEEENLSRGAAEYYCQFVLASTMSHA